MSAATGVPVSCETKLNSDSTDVILKYLNVDCFLRTIRLSHFRPARLSLDNLLHNALNLTDLSYIPGILAGI